MKEKESRMLSFLSKKPKTENIRWGWDHQWDPAVDLMMPQGGSGTSLQLDDFLDVKPIPKWFKNMPTLVDEVRHHPGNNSNEKLMNWFYQPNNWNALFDKRLDQHTTFRTMKGCPAVLNQFTHSVLIKTPSDLFIEVHEKYGPRFKSHLDCMSFTGHAPNQTEGSPLDKNFWIIKAHTPLIFSSEVGNRVFYQDCLWEKIYDFRIVPGHIGIKTKEIVPITFFMAFPRNLPTAKYVLKRGEPLAYITFMNKFKKFIYDESLFKKHRRDQYQRHFSYFEKPKISYEEN